MRYRALYLLFFDFGYSYAAEFGKPAGSNQLSLLAQWQPTRQVDWRAISGYNFLTEKKENLVNQLTYYPRKKITAYLSNTYSLENQTTLSWQTELTLGEIQKDYLLLGFTYSNPDKYYLRSSLVYALSKSWKIEFTGRQDLSRAVNQYFEKDITLTRDLHCWVLSFYYRGRPTVKELLRYFYL